MLKPSSPLTLTTKTFAAAGILGNSPLAADAVWRLQKIPPSRQIASQPLAGQSFAKKLLRRLFTQGMLLAQSFPAQPICAPCVAAGPAAHFLLDVWKTQKQRLDVVSAGGLKIESSPE